MAISLSSLSAPKAKPVIGTILGEAGVGKTTLAASFPNPVIVPIEDGLQALEGRDIPAFPLINSTNELMDALNALATEEHNFKTVVFDSVTRLNEIFESEIIESDPKRPKSINQALGGYGAGHASVAQKHRELRELCGTLRDKFNMNVLFIAHADTETLELPDQDPYQRYTIRMNKRSVSAYVDNVDLVGLLRLKTFTTGDGDRKRAIADGTVELVTYPHPSGVSKNRYGINKALTVVQDENPLKPYIKALA